MYSKTIIEIYPQTEHHAGLHAEGFCRRVEVALDCGHRKMVMFHEMGDPLYTSRFRAEDSTRPEVGDDCCCRKCSLTDENLHVFQPACGWRRSVKSQLYYDMVPIIGENHAHNWIYEGSPWAPSVWELAEFG